MFNYDLTIEFIFTGWLVHFVYIHLVHHVQIVMVSVVCIYVVFDSLGCKFGYATLDFIGIFLINIS